MNNSKKVAIIGVNGTFPGAKNLADLDRIFSKQEDCIQTISAKRIQLAGEDPSKQFLPMAYIEDLDFFDYGFFGISRKEALEMDPQHRFSLESACKAIESAGYSLKQLRGSNTGVFVGAENNGYEKLFSKNENNTTTGTLVSYIAGRISYLLDLHGEAATISSACSSALYAVYEAYFKLIMGQCDLALAGGVNLSYQIFDQADPENAFATLGIMSKEGHCKTFDDTADGINLCEGVGFILLKRLEDAIHDQDSILAVISGAGANQDGARSNSFTAPSVTAQAELYERVWKQAGIQPEEIGYVEAHGTGTKIGDPIEIAALTEAFRTFSNKKQICPIGSLKTNFGHALFASGIASILKAIVSIQQEKKYPLRTLGTPNHLINFSDSPFYPITKEETWTEKKKIFAINSFGFSGTNVHVLIENYVPEHPKKPQIASAYLVKVSTKSPENLNRYKQQIFHSLHPTDTLNDISYVLNCGRDDYSYRCAAVVKNRAELEAFLCAETVSESIPAVAPKVALLCSGNSHYTAEEIAAMQNDYPIFAARFAVLQKQYPHLEQAILVDAALLEQLKAVGVSADVLLGTGTGSLSIQLFRSKLPLDATQIKRFQAHSDTDFAKEKFVTYMKNWKDSENGNLLCIDLKENGILLECLKQQPDFQSIRLLSAVQHASILHCLSQLYLLGLPLEFSALYPAQNRNKILLATYPFLKTAAWPTVTQKTVLTNAAAPQSEPQEDLRTFLRNLWIHALELETLDDADDLFDLGINSMLAISVLKKIHQRTGLDLDFDEIYDYYTIDLQYDYIIEHSESERQHLAQKTIEPQTAAPVSNTKTQITVVPRTPKMEISGNQKRMLYILEDSPNPSLYNMPVCYQADGKLNMELFCEVLREIVEKHDILHTIYHHENGDFYQEVLTDYTLNIHMIDEGWKTEGEVNEILRQEFLKPFDLFREIPIRIVIIKVSNSIHYIMINVHHIASDGWSLGIAIKEINQLYQYKCTDHNYHLPKGTLQYADFAAYENTYLKSKSAEEEFSYWKEKLDGIRGILDFPINKTRPAVQTYHGDSIFFEIETDWNEKISAFCRSKRISKFVLLESAYAILLYKYAGISDFCIGTPIANRNLEEVETIFGFFANSAAIRSIFEPSETIAAFLRRNTETIEQALHHATVPFDEIVKQIKFERSPAHAALYQYFFTYENFKYETFKLKDTVLEEVDLHSNVVRFDLNFVLKERAGTILINAEYDKELFTSDYVKEITENYKRILQMILENEQMMIDSIALCSEKNILESKDLLDSLF